MYTFTGYHYIFSEFNHIGKIFIREIVYDSVFLERWSTYGYINGNKMEHK